MCIQIRCLNTALDLFWISVSYSVRKLGFGSTDSNPVLGSLLWADSTSLPTPSCGRYSAIPPSKATSKLLCTLREQRTTAVPEKVVWPVRSCHLF